jgi:hypothetical protein
MLVFTGFLLHLIGPAPKGLSAEELAATTPNDFLRRGVPTFVIGTSGDDRSDRVIRSQAELVRNLLFPQARIVTDESIDVGRGPGAWPPNPILVADTFVCYPDPAGKVARTGDGGDGHAVPATHALHVLRFDPSEGGALERLVAHERTHLLTHDAWGLAGTPRWARGWRSGNRGRRRTSWRRRSRRPWPPIPRPLASGADLEWPDPG